MLVSKVAYIILRKVIEQYLCFLKARVIPQLIAKVSVSSLGDTGRETLLKSY